jgi:hypothetical protein
MDIEMFLNNINNFYHNYLVNVLILDRNIYNTNLY